MKRLPAYDIEAINKIFEFTEKVKGGIIMTNAEFDEGIAMIDNYDPRRRLTYSKLLLLKELCSKYEEV